MKALNDTELFALSVMLQSTNVMIESENQNRLRNGEALAYPDSCFPSEEEELIMKELKRRGIYENLKEDKCDE